MPPADQLVALKMMEPRAYRYSIGWYSKEQRIFVLVAKPETDAKLEAISWIALPKWDVFHQPDRVNIISGQAWAVALDLILIPRFFS